MRIDTVNLPAGVHATVLTGWVTPHVVADGFVEHAIVWTDRPHPRCHRPGCHMPVELEVFDCPVVLRDGALHELDTLHVCGEVLTANWLATNCEADVWVYVTCLSAQLDADREKNR